MSYKNYLDGLLPIGELLVAIIPADEEADGNTFSDFLNQECITKMREPVARGGYFFPVAGDRMKKLVDMAWYFDPDEETEPRSIWDEKARKKMREPVAHGFRIFLNPDRLQRLAEMV